MTTGIPLLAIGLASIALLLVLAICYLALSMRAHDEQRESMEARRLAAQPWDSAGERANR
jgi:hypothetical protein